MRSSGGQRSIPEGWRMVLLGDVAEVAFSGVDKRKVEGELPVELCNYTDVFYNRRIHSGMEFMAATATPVELGRWALRKGDVLFTKDSETADEIGIPSYVAEDMAMVLCGYHLGMACPKMNKVNGAFLARTLASRSSAQEFGRIANGITRFGLTLDATRNLPILLPPLPEQRAIATVLDSIDDAIEQTEAVIAATEQLRDSLLHQLLTRGVPGWHTAWKDVPGLGTIPADWDVVRLGEVAETITSGSRAWSQYFRPNGAFFVRSQNIIGGRIDRSDAIWVEPPPDGEAERTRICEGDLLISITGEPGKTTVADSNLGQAFVSQHVALVRLRDPQLSYFAGRFLQGSTGQKQLGRMAYGQTRPGLSLLNVGDTKIAVPTVAEQQAITGLLDSVDEALEQARNQTNVLQCLKESTADALLTGRVRVGPCKGVRDDAATRQ